MKICLMELLQYFDLKAGTSDKIQIVLDGAEWDDSYELYVNSALLAPYIWHTVVQMGIVESLDGDEFILRVALEKGEEYGRLEKETHFKEVLGGGVQLCRNADHGIRCIGRNSRKDYCFDHGWCICDCVHHCRRAC